MFTIWQCGSQHLLASATNMEEVQAINVPSLESNCYKGDMSTVQHTAMRYHECATALHHMTRRVHQKLYKQVQELRVHLVPYFLFHFQLHKVKFPLTQVLFKAFL